MVELKPPPGGRDRKIRLEVPPLSAPEPAAAERRGVQWTAAVALVGLLGLAVAFFFVLPHVVQTRQEDVPPAEPAAPTVEPDEPEEAEAPEPAAVPAVAAERVAPPPERSEPAPADPFVEAMSQGLAALERDDFAAARDAFRQAKKLRSGAPESADGLSRAEAGLRRLELDAFHEQARAAEEAEDWHAAVTAYEAALKVDPAVGFALEGVERARDRADLDDRLRFHLENAERLSSSEVLEEASRLLRRASEVATDGARLPRQVEALGQMVESYSQPVRVELRSDNLTEITVYRVGRLGTFESRDLSLRPGTYTVVGSRDGYRDVRRRLIVEPGKEPTPLEVRCEEKI